MARHFRPLAETRPDILARHHEAAGNYQDAFECWLAAGQAAAQRSANIEAMQHFEHSEALLKHQADLSGRDLDSQWLALFQAKGPTLISLFGWAAPEVEEIYRAALTLIKRMNLENRDNFRVWGGLFNVYLLRGDLADARATMERSHGIAKKASDPELLMSSHRSLGLCCLLAAEFGNALDHMARVEELLSMHPEQKRRQTTKRRRIVSLFQQIAWCYWFPKAVRAYRIDPFSLSLCEARLFQFHVSKS